MIIILLVIIINITVEIIIVRLITTIMKMRTIR